MDNIEMNEVSNIVISNHVMERYAERILNKKEKVEITRYVVNQKEKITKDITKMIVYGKLIYSGKNPRKDRFGSTNKVNMYIKDSWIVLVNPDNNTVITLFKKDLGLGDEEFNKQYVEKLINKFIDTQSKVCTVQEEVEEKNKQLLLSIKSNEEKINNYRSYIKQLEEANNGYKAIMESNYIAIKEVEEELNEVLEIIVTK